MLAYLYTVRKLLMEHQCTEGLEQKQVFIKMMHAFIQELCGYPPASYIVTAAADHTAEVAGPPHVVPASYATHRTLFYFTASENSADLHDLWVRHAQVYLVDPYNDDIAAERATDVIFTNFFIVDGARKDDVTGAWNLWSAYDLQLTQAANIDIRNLESGTELASITSRVIRERLQANPSQLPSPASETAEHEQGLSPSSQTPLRS